MTPMEGRRPFSNPKLEAWRIVRWWGGRNQTERVRIKTAHRKWCDDRRVHDVKWRATTLDFAQQMIEELALKQLRQKDPLAGGGK